MRALSSSTLLSLVILAGVACSNPDDSGGSTPGGGGSGGGGQATQGTPSSCDLTKDGGFCVEFDASAPEGTARGNCKGAKSTLDYDGVLSETSPCPTANRVGSCTALVTGVMTTYRYYAPKWDAATVEQYCADIGDGTGVFTKG